MPQTGCNVNTPSTGMHFDSFSLTLEKFFLCVLQVMQAVPFLPFPMPQCIQQCLRPAHMCMTGPLPSVRACKCLRSARCSYPRVRISRRPLSLCRAPSSLWRWWRTRPMPSSLRSARSLTCPNPGHPSTRPSKRVSKHVACVGCLRPHNGVHGTHTMTTPHGLTSKATTLNRLQVVALL